MEEPSSPVKEPRPSTPRGVLEVSFSQETLSSLPTEPQTPTGSDELGSGWSAFGRNGRAPALGGSSQRKLELHARPSPRSDSAHGEADVVRKRAPVAPFGSEARDSPQAEPSSRISDPEDDRATRKAVKGGSWPKSGRASPLDVETSQNSETGKQTPRSVLDACYDSVEPRSPCHSFGSTPRRFESSNGETDHLDPGLPHGEPAHGERCSFSKEERFYKDHKRDKRPEPLSGREEDQLVALRSVSPNFPSAPRFSTQWDSYASTTAAGETVHADMAKQAKGGVMRPKGRAQARTPQARVQNKKGISPSPGSYRPRDNLFSTRGVSAWRKPSSSTATRKPSDSVKEGEKLVLNPDKPTKKISSRAPSFALQEKRKAAFSSTDAAPPPGQYWPLHQVTEKHGGSARLDTTAEREWMMPAPGAGKDLSPPFSHEQIAHSGAPSIVPFGKVRGRFDGGVHEEDRRDFLGSEEFGEQRSDFGPLILPKGSAERVDALKITRWPSVGTYELQRAWQLTQARGICPAAFAFGKRAGVSSQGNRIRKGQHGALSLRALESAERLLFPSTESHSVPREERSKELVPDMRSTLDVSIGATRVNEASRGAPAVLYAHERWDANDSKAQASAGEPGPGRYEQDDVMGIGAPVPAFGRSPRWISGGTEEASEKGSSSDVLSHTEALAAVAGALVDFGAQVGRAVPDASKGIRPLGPRVLDAADVEADADKPLRERLSGPVPLDKQQSRDGEGADAAGTSSRIGPGTYEPNSKGTLFDGSGAQWTFSQSPKGASEAGHGGPVDLEGDRLLLQPNDYATRQRIQNAIIEPEGEAEKDAKGKAAPLERMQAAVTYLNRVSTVEETRCWANFATAVGREEDDLSCGRHQFRPLLPHGEPGEGGNLSSAKSSFLARGREDWKGTTMADPLEGQRLDLDLHGADSQDRGSGKLVDYRAMHGRPGLVSRQFEAEPWHDAVYEPQVHQAAGSGASGLGVFVDLSKQFAHDSRPVEPGWELDAGCYEPRHPGKREPLSVGFAHGERFRGCQDAPYGDNVGIEGRPGERAYPGPSYSLGRRPGTGLVPSLSRPPHQ